MKIEWKKIPLNQLVLGITNGMTRTQIDTETMYPVTRIETISDETIDMSRVKYLQTISIKDIKKYRLENGDILFSHINSISHIGKTALYQNKPKMLIHGMNLLKIRPDPKKINPKYLFFYTKYEVFKDRVISLAKKAVNQASITQRDLGSILILVPPMDEQIKIVKKMDEINYLIELEVKYFEKLKLLEKGMLQKLLSEKLDA